MRTLKLTLAYDGTRYAGWQVQNSSQQSIVHSPQKSQQPTIQGTLEAALCKILRARVRVIGSGRTDAGVHALGQVAHLRTSSPIALRRLQHALNALVPRDIVVTKVDEAPAGFHARFQANTKRYRYQIITGDYVLPFERPYVHHVRVPLNIALMRREARQLLGRHDVRAFHASGRPVADTRRTITDVRLSRRGRCLTFEIEGDGFLYKMVRTIVGTLIDIGRGYRPPGTMARLLRAKERRLAGPSAPARGLCLVSVRYAA